MENLKTLKGYKKKFNCVLKSCKVINIAKFDDFIICKGCKKHCKALPLARVKRIHIPKVIENITFKGSQCYEIQTGKTSRYFNAGDYSVYWSTGNKKVGVPIISVGTALHCNSKDCCNFHYNNYKTSGYPICYACRDELQYPSALACRLVNEKSLQLANCNNDSFLLGLAIGQHIASYCKTKGLQYCRINESGDLASWNILFVKGFLTALNLLGVNCWLYTKQLELSKELESYKNLKILESEVDFICVKKGDIPKFPICPGIGCGKTCLRCPMGLKTSILKH